MSKPKYCYSHTAWIREQVWNDPSMSKCGLSKALFESLKFEELAKYNAIMQERGKGGSDHGRTT